MSERFQVPGGNWYHPGQRVEQDGVGGTIVGQHFFSKLCIVEWDDGPGYPVWGRSNPEEESMKLVKALNGFSLRVRRRLADVSSQLERDKKEFLNETREETFARMDAEFKEWKKKHSFEYVCTQADKDFLKEMKISVDSQDCKE